MQPDPHAAAEAALKRGSTREALQALMPLLERPAHDAPDGLKLLVRLALSTGRLDLAARGMRVAMARFPQDAGLHALSAAGAHMAGDKAGCERAARRALAIDPTEPTAAAILARLLADQLRMGEARAIADALLEARPDDCAMRMERANLSLFAGDATGAAHDAATAARTCDTAQAHQLAAQAALYLERDDPAATLEQQRSHASRIAGYRLPPPGPRGGRPLRVGILSPDLRRHPVGLLAAPLLARNEAIDACCYHDGASDQTTARLRDGAAHWRETRTWSDAELVRQMQDDRLDVLLDLAGHSAGSRPRLLASRIAPRQYGYLGHLCDTGFDTCDGTIGDRWNLPEDTIAVRMPIRIESGFLAFTTDAEAPTPRARTPMHGDMVFGSFNHLAKLCDATVALWSDLLHTAPRTRLVLCAMGLADASVRAATHARFAAHGIDAARIECRPPVLDPRMFLAQYDHIDVALDPLPFNGGYTSLQALWQGVPVVSLPGRRMAARTGASILSRIGLHDMLALDRADYIGKAIEWAGSGSRLAQFRSQSRERIVASGITDARSFAESFARMLTAAG